MYLGNAVIDGANLADYRSQSAAVGRAMMDQVRFIDRTPSGVMQHGIYCLAPVRPA